LAFLEYIPGSLYTLPSGNVNGELFAVVIVTGLTPVASCMNYHISFYLFPLILKIRTCKLAFTYNISDLFLDRNRKRYGGSYED
jgi:hypothetical protein